MSKKQQEKETLNLYAIGNTIGSSCWLLDTYKLRVFLLLNKHI